MPTPTLKHNPTLSNDNMDIDNPQHLPPTNMHTETPQDLTTKKNDINPPDNNGNIDIHTLTTQTTPAKRKAPNTMDKYLITPQNTTGPPSPTPETPYAKAVDPNQRKKKSTTFQNNKKQLKNRDINFAANHYAAYNPSNAKSSNLPPPTYVLNHEFVKRYEIGVSFENKDEDDTVDIVLWKALKNIFLAIHNIDPTATLLPWGGAMGKKGPLINNPNNISSERAIFRNYVDKLPAKNDIKFTSIAIFLASNMDPIEFVPSAHSTIRELNNGGFFRLRDVQAPEIQPLGWLLYSTRMTNIEDLKDKVYSDLNIEVGFRLKALYHTDPQKKHLAYPPRIQFSTTSSKFVQAVHVECGKQHAFKVKGWLKQHFGSKTTNYPFQNKMRFVPHEYDVTDSLSKGTILTLMRYQSAFLEGIKFLQVNDFTNINDIIHKETYTRRNYVTLFDNDELVSKWLQHMQLIDSDLTVAQTQTQNRTPNPDSDDEYTKVISMLNAGPLRINSIDHFLYEAQAISFWDDTLKNYNTPYNREQFIDDLSTLPSILLSNLRTAVKYQLTHMIMSPGKPSDSLEDDPSRPFEYDELLVYAKHPSQPLPSDPTRPPILLAFHEEERTEDDDTPFTFSHHSITDANKGTKTKNAQGTSKAIYILTRSHIHFNPNESVTGAVKDHWIRQQDFLCRIEEFLRNMKLSDETEQNDILSIDRHRDGSPGCVITVSKDLPVSACSKLENFLPYLSHLMSVPINVFASIANPDKYSSLQHEEWDPKYNKVLTDENNELLMLTCDDVDVDMLSAQMKEQIQIEFKTETLSHTTSNRLLNQDADIGTINTGLKSSRSSRTQQEADSASVISKRSLRSRKSAKSTSQSDTSYRSTSGNIAEQQTTIHHLQNNTSHDEISTLQSHGSSRISITSSELRRLRRTEAKYNALKYNNQQKADNQVDTSNSLLEHNKESDSDEGAAS